MGLFGGSSKNNVTTSTDVDVAVNPVFTVGIDTAETLERAVNSFGSQFGNGLSGGAAALAIGVQDTSKTFSDGLQTSASLIALGLVGAGLIFAISRA